MQIIPLPAFSDNYIWLIREGRHAVVVDPGDAAPVLEYLQNNALRLAAVLITHHHADHVDGLPALLAEYPVPVYGPRREAIAGVDRPLDDRDHVSIEELGLAFEVIAVPGHTLGHIAYYTPGHLFCGDTLFCGGCGRIFEGTPAQLHASLERLPRCLPRRRSIAHTSTHSRTFVLRDWQSLRMRHAKPSWPNANACETRADPRFRVPSAGSGRSTLSCVAANQPFEPPPASRRDTP